jgi:DNA-binding transcriptional MocR family regulator
VLSAGVRVGFVTGPPALIDRVNMLHQCTVLHPSGLSQAVVAKLLALWRVGEGDAGGVGAAMEDHLAAITGFYGRQCDALVAAAERHLRAADGRMLVEFARPSAGMFLWMSMAPAGVTDSAALISTRAVAAGVLLVPGSAFYHDGRASPFARASFSTASPGDLDAAMARLGGLLKAGR